MGFSIIDHPDGSAEISFDPDPTCPEETVLEDRLRTFEKAGVQGLRVMIFMNEGEMRDAIIHAVDAIDALDQEVIAAGSDDPEMTKRFRRATNLLFKVVREIAGPDYLLQAQGTPAKK